MSGTGGERPSRESMREVKREYKARRNAEKKRAEDAAAYWAGQTGRPQRAGLGRGAVAAVAALTVVGVGAAAVGLQIGPFSRSTSAAPVAASSLTPTGRTPTPSPSTSASPAPGTDPTVHAAFDDSPARTWKSGIGAVTMPHATRVGIFRTSQVAEAYTMMRRYVAAAVLDTSVVFKGEMAPVLSAFGSGFATQAKVEHKKWVANDGTSGFGWVDLANRFHPGDWRAAAEIRVRGHVGKAVVHGSAIRIPFVVVAAYWLVPKGGTQPRTIAVRRSGWFEFIGYGPRHVWMWQWEVGYMSSAAVCNAIWRYPDYVEAWASRVSAPVSASPAPAGSGGASFDLSDPDAVEPSGSGCYTDTSGFS